MVTTLVISVAIAGMGQVALLGGGTFDTPEACLEQLNSAAWLGIEPAQAQAVCMPKAEWDAQRARIRGDEGV